MRRRQFLLLLESRDGHVQHRRNLGNPHADFRFLHGYRYHGGALTQQREPGRVLFYRNHAGMTRYRAGVFRGEQDSQYRPARENVRGNGGRFHDERDVNPERPYLVATALQVSPVHGGPRVLSRRRFRSVHAVLHGRPTGGRGNAFGQRPHSMRRRARTDQRHKGHGQRHARVQEQEDICHKRCLNFRQCDRFPKRGILQPVRTER